MENKCTVVLTVSLMLEKDNKILMIKRKNTGYMDNMYAFIGGHVEKGESLKQAMIRESYEEAGVNIKEEDLEFVCAIRRGGHSGYVNVFFRTSKYQNEPEIKEKDKCEEMIWVDKNNMPEDTIEAEKRAIYNYENNIFLDEYEF